MNDTGSDFASAALRHIRDAEHLLTGGANSSRDQAWHLAGFAHECARKAFIGNGWIPKLLGHKFSDANEQIVEIAISLDPRAGRFPVRRWADRYPAIAAWRVEHRYERTGASDDADDRNIEDLVSQGREAVDSCILALFLDGSLERASIGC
jgi:hypothetical protein